MTDDGRPVSPFPSVRAGLPATAPFDWLRQGFADLKACGTASLFYGLCFAAMGVLMIAAFRQAVHLLTAVTTGFMLVGPFFAIGLYELSRRREAGEAVRLGPSLSAWKRNLNAIGIYSLILIVLYLVWARASLVVFALFYAGGMPSIEGFLAEVGKFDNLEFLLAYLAVGGLFAGLVFASSVVSIPLMLDRQQDAVTAVLASVLAVVRNLPVLLVWAALIVALVVLGIATAFLGLVLTGPLVGHATWHAYRALIEPVP